MSIEPETPAAVGDDASMADVIDLSEITLIGIFRTPDSARTMLCLPSGRITSVNLGERSRAGRLVEVGEDWARFERAGAETELHMPSS